MSYNSCKLFVCTFYKFPLFCSFFEQLIKEMIKKTSTFSCPYTLSKTFIQIDYKFCILYTYIFILAQICTAISAHVFDDRCMNTFREFQKRRTENKKTTTYIHIHLENNNGQNVGSIFWQKILNEKLTLP